ncbi:MAG: YceI family protein [Moheibacter sp.]
MKRAIFAILIAVSGIMSAQSVQTIKNDPAHSMLGFSVSHMTISLIEGHFSDFSVEFSFSKPDFSDAKFTVTAKTSSIDTRVEARNNHLKSADFFEVEKYPELKFVSTSMVKTIGNQYDLFGNLTIHGVTKPVKLKAVYNGSVENPMSKELTHGFTVSGMIDKSDFGIGSGFPASFVGNDIKIVSNLEFPVKK